jgi:hypothetical protein
MGAAIECFQGAEAILIPRTRFAPVKTTNDMLALMSDAYLITPDFRMELVPERHGVPPNVKLDGSYKFVDAMAALVVNGPPSLVKCDKLAIEGSVVLEAGVVFEGNVKVIGGADGPKVLMAGVYANQTVEL